MSDEKAPTKEIWKNVKYLLAILLLGFFYGFIMMVPLMMLMGLDSVDEFIDPPIVLFFLWGICTVGWHLYLKERMEINPPTNLKRIQFLGSPFRGKQKESSSLPKRLLIPLDSSAEEAFEAVKTHLIDDSSYGYVRPSSVKGVRDLYLTEEEKSQQEKEEEFEVQVKLPQELYEPQDAELDSKLVSNLEKSDPDKNYKEYKERFVGMTDEQLRNTFNREVGNSGWTSSKASYLSALHEELEKRNIVLTDKRILINEPLIPEGLYKCKKCGEYKGEVMKKDLNWDGSFHKAEAEKSEEYLGVSCLCEGILCHKCKKNKIHRPISNSYDPETNQIWHYPYFQGMKSCGECGEKSGIIKI